MHLLHKLDNFASNERSKSWESENGVEFLLDETVGAVLQGMVERVVWCEVASAALDNESFDVDEPEYTMATTQTELQTLSQFTQTDPPRQPSRSGSNIAATGPVWPWRDPGPSPRPPSDQVDDPNLALFPLSPPLQSARGNSRQGGRSRPVSRETSSSFFITETPNSLGPT